MEVFYKIISLLGGLALFLYGMRIMGDGLKSGSGGAMKAALAKVTTKPIMSFILGVLVTCMIQSSTATIVLTVGLVGAGFLTFRQSIGIVLGANVGTAITAQIIRLMDVDAGATSILYFFKSDNLAPLALLIGIILIMFVKKKSAAATGTILMGFGILFVGLMNMSAAVSTMRESLSTLLTRFGSNPVLGFLTGVAVTGVIQSSSAVIGILQSIASSVGVRFCEVFCIIIGVNIGDCLTTFLVCRIGAKPEQVRTCLVHIIYNIFAATLIIVTLVICRSTGIMNDAIWEVSLKSGGVANIHGLFRLIPAVLLLPFSGVFAKIAEKLVPDRVLDSEEAEIEQSLRELDERLISTPDVALAEAEHLIGHMADVAFKNITASFKQIYMWKEKRDGKISTREDLIDRMADASSQYLVSISPKITLESDRRNQNFLLRAVTCFERIGDLGVNIENNVTHMKDNGEEFSEVAKRELSVAIKAVREITNLAFEAYKTRSISMAKKVEPLEEVIDELIEAVRSGHMKRLAEGNCNPITGIEFMNILQHLERISDQCSDLAVYQLGRSNPAISGKEHQYIHNLHHSNDPFYLEEFHRAHKHFFEELKNAETDPGFSPEEFEKRSEEIDKPLSKGFTAKELVSRSN